MQKYFLYVLLCRHCLVPDQTSEELFAQEVQRSICNLVTPRVNNVYLTEPEYKIIHRKARLKKKKMRKIFIFVFLLHLVQLIYCGTEFVFQCELRPF